MNKDDKTKISFTEEEIEAFRTSEMNIKCIYYKGCRIEKSRTSHGAPKWLLYMSEEEGAKLQDTFTTKEHAMDYIDELEVEKKKSDEKQKPKSENKFPLVVRSEFIERSKTVHRNSSVVNIGYAEGLLSDTRPFRMECWAEDQITNLTIFISKLGLEDYTPQKVIDYLEVERIIRRLKDDLYGSVLSFKDPDGNEFWSANLVVGDEDDTYLDSVPLKKWYD